MLECQMRDMEDKHVLLWTYEYTDPKFQPDLKHYNLVVSYAQRYSRILKGYQSIWSVLHDDLIVHLSIP